MGPLYKFGWFDFAYSLQLAALIGFCFGFVLERAGFGNPRKLTAIFYLKDFAVLKVMFTAIVVCVVGLLYFAVFGWIDLQKIYILPTFLWPQIVGGLILGIGFVMGGYCPTTSVVATVSGKLDGLVFIVGMILGSLLFAWLFPLFEGLYSAGSMGAITLPDILRLQSGLIAFFVCLMAVCAFWFVEKVEQKFGDAETLPQGSRKMKISAALILIGLGLVLAIVNPDQIVAEKKTPLATKPQVLDAPEEPSPTADQPSDTFTIVEDEGC
jgi:uncharacterized membrane protein YedE/YeeE